MIARTDPIKSSVFLPALRFANRLTFPVRALTSDEIQDLEHQGCECEDWSALRVAEDFRTARIHHVRFRGQVILGRLYGYVQTGGSKEPAGLENTTLEDSWIEDGVAIRDTSLISHMRIGNGVGILGCGRITHTPGSAFGVGFPIPIIETGGRVTRSFPEMSLEDAAGSVRPAGNIRALAAYLRRIDAYAAHARSEYGVIQAHARVLDTPRVENAFLGHSARVLAVTRISNTVVLSEEKHPTIIEDGAILNGSAVQWGCHVSSLSIVDGSLLCEYSQVERHGKVLSSIIGPNTTIAEGEVTSSLVGPFVGFHHQALLIGVVWPEGKGNVGYGCNCGSNHTGKAPDQEFWPGEGMFLGLGVNVKYPGCFTEAPYTIVATGTDLPPQRVAFPFSLITASTNPRKQLLNQMGEVGQLGPAHSLEQESFHVPGGEKFFLESRNEKGFLFQRCSLYGEVDLLSQMNEIIPAWVLRNNLFAIKRNERKFKSRDKSFRTPIEYRILRADIVRMMITARTQLQGLGGKDFYTGDRDLPALGKNYMTDHSRREAIETYSFHIQFFALEGLFQRLLVSGRISPTLLKRPSANAEWEFQRQLLHKEGLQGSPEELLLSYLDRLKIISNEVRESKARDDHRGIRIIPDYADHHVLAVENPFVLEFRAEVDGIEEQVLDLLDQ